MKKILFIEDESALAEIVKESLESKDFEVYHALTLSQASLLYQKHKPDIIIADVMLPDGSGFDWIVALRQTDNVTPIIFLTSRSQTEDVVKGFESGGNDYLKKPFSLAELIVRIQALINRPHKSFTSSNAQKQTWHIGKFNFHYPSGLLDIKGKQRQLTSREADLLNLLLLNKNEALSRNDILQILWGNNDYFSGRSLDVFITKLRKYLKPDPSVKIINIRGVGYKIVD